MARTQLAVYYYQYRINDLIERYQTQTDFFFFRNRGRARLRGFEIEARSELGKGYSLEIAAQVARGRALDDNAHLDDISPASLSVIGRKDFTDRVYAQTRVAWYAEDDRPGPSEIAAPGATLRGRGRRMAALARSWNCVVSSEICSTMTTTRALMRDGCSRRADRSVLRPLCSSDAANQVEF